MPFVLLCGIQTLLAWSTCLIQLSTSNSIVVSHKIFSPSTTRQLSRIKSLEQISFEGCKFITDAGIPFLTTLPRLREISIGGCPKITRSGMTRFSDGVQVNYDPR